MATFVAMPTLVAHTMAAVYTNGVLSAETSAGSGLWYALSNGVATVVYTADEGFFFEGGAKAVTNALDTTVNPAVNNIVPPEVLARVEYVDERGVTRAAVAHIITATGSRVMWNTGWYAVMNDVTITGGADVSGAVKLILADGAKLTIDGVADGCAGIGVSGAGNAFAVYGQVGGTGALDVTGGWRGAGIGGGVYGAGSNIAINGGTVATTGGHWGAGIGGGAGRTGSGITIIGGTVTATGGAYGAGIGGGSGGTGANIFVADSVLIRAGDSPDPTDVIPHASSATDISSSLAGKRYATAETIVVYPSYLEGKSEAVRAKFEAWAKAYPPGDPDGIYTNAFLFNVATNREAEALAAFKIGSISITNEVVGTVTNTVVVVERAQPLPPATTFNGDTWLQCATNGLGAAEWLDIGDGRYTEKEHSFIIQRIDFEHTLTPESFPTEPTGTKAMRVKVVE